MATIVYDLQGYPHFVVDFAERQSRKAASPQQLADLLIRSIFEDGGLGRIVSVDSIEPGNLPVQWIIRFTGETNGRTADPYIATYDGESISYNDDPSRQPRNLSEVQILEFQSKKGIKNCTKGKPCGGSCIAKGKNCRITNLTQNQKQAADELSKVVVATGGANSKDSRESLQEEVDLRRLRDRLKELEARKKDRQAKGLYGKEAGKQGDDWALGMEIPALRKQILDQRVKVEEAKRRRAEELASVKAQQESRVDQPQRARNDDNNIAERYKDRPKADRNISGLALATIDYVARNAGYNITSSRKGYKVTKDDQEFTFPRLIDVDRFISSRR